MKKLKKLRIIALLFILSSNLIGQKTNIISLQYGKGINTLIRFTLLDGDASYDGEGSFNFGISFQHYKSKRFSIHTGLIYSHQKIILTPSYYPGKDLTKKRGSIQLLSIPIMANFNFGKYFFIGLQEITDFELSSSKDLEMDNQSGIGLGIFTGAKLIINNISLRFTPYFNVHSLVPFVHDKHKQHLFDSGINLSLGYYF